MNKRLIYILSLISISLFLALLPLSLKVVGTQNDDWVYYKMLVSFMNGNFKLDSYTAATFYLQGFLALVFANLFGFSKIPVLTLLVSCLSFFIVSLAVYKFFYSNIKLSIIIGLLFFVNPLFMYSIWGFMTENYFILFLVFSIYFILAYEKYNEKKYIALTNISIFLGYLVRQFSFAISLAFGLYLLAKRDYKRGIIQLGLFFLLIIFHYYIFPKTPVMLERGFELENLVKLRNAITFTYVNFIYIAAFILPLIFLLFVNSDKKVYLILLAILLFAMSYVSFKPKILAWREFYYHQNTLERTGFFPRGINGTKYSFKGIYDLYKYWDIVAKISAVTLLSYIIVHYKKTVNFFSIFIVIYSGLLLISPILYDRYLLPLFPISIFFCLTQIKQSKQVFLVIPFLIFLGFYVYNFSMDYVLANNFVWTESEKLVLKDRINAIDIYSTHGWRKSYLERKPLYLFSYDPPSIVRCCYTLVEKEKIYFPFSFFIEPNIYLYKQN